MHKIGIGCECFGKDNIIKILPLIKKADFSTTFIGDYYSDKLFDYTKAIQDNGLELETVHSDFSNINSVWLDQKEGDIKIDGLIQGLERTARTNAKIYVLHVSSGYNHPSATLKGLNRLSRLVMCAEQFKIKLAFENVRPGNNLEKVLNEFKNSKFVGLCYDCGHEHCYYDDNSKYPQIYNDKIFCLHLHDNLGKLDLNKDGDHHRLPFDGNIDYNRVCKLIYGKQRNYSIMLEVNALSDFYNNYTFEKFLNNAKLSANKINFKICELETLFS